MKKALILTNQSGFLWKFELENVLLLQSLGFIIHYASNSAEEGYHYDPRDLDRMGVIYHDIPIARSPYMWRMNFEALRRLLDIVENEKIDLIHCHTPVGGVLGRLAGYFSKRHPAVIYTAHGFHFYKGAPLWNNVLYRAVEQLLAPLSDILIVINREDFAAAQKNLLMHIFLASLIYTFFGMLGAFYYQAMIDSVLPCGLTKTLTVLSIGMILLSLFKMDRLENTIRNYSMQPEKLSTSGKKTDKEIIQK